MDPAFFVGKNAILKWLNDFFQINYTKIEQTASGAIHCQILDACFPGKVPMAKVNFDAKYDYEFVKNYKVLQTIFDKENIIKHVDVTKLVRAKYQDNLEMCQWMKHFFETRYDGHPYDPIARRSRSKGGAATKGKSGARTASRRVEAKPKAETSKSAEGSSGTRAAAPRVGAGASSRTGAGAARSGAGASRTGAASTRTGTKAATSRTRTGGSKPTGTRRVLGTSKTNGAGPSAVTKKALEEKDEKIADLNDQIAKLMVSVEGMEKERTFYFDKLREIEILCQDEELPADVNFREEILKIMYKTDPEDEFQAPEGEGEEGEGEEEDMQDVDAQVAALELEEELVGDDLLAGDDDDNLLM